MSYQNISAVITAEDFKIIKQSIDILHKKMPFLVALTPDERRDLYKMGPKSLDFLRGCQTVLQNHPNIFPPDFNAKEMMRDSNLYEQLLEISYLLSALQEKVSDTSIAIGSETMKSSLAIYTYVKAASKLQPGLKSAEEMLHQRFKGQGVVKAPKPSDEVA